MSKVYYGGDRKVFSQVWHIKGLCKQMKGGKMQKKL